MTLAEIRTFAIIQAIDLIKHIDTAALDDGEETKSVIVSAKLIEKFILTGK